MRTSTAGSCNKIRRPSGLRQDGFTLIELAVVVLLIGLFSMLTVPMLTGFGENALDLSARRLAGSIKYLFNESALQRREFRLLFNLDEGTLQAKVLEDTGELTEVSGFAGTQELRGDVRFQNIIVAGHGTFSSGEVTTVIHPVGWMEETVIHLQDEDEHTLTLRVMPFTGSTEIYEGYREFDKEL